MEFIRMIGESGRSGPSAIDQPILGQALRPGIARRFGAILYDCILLCGVLFVATALLLPWNGGKAIEPGHWLLSIYLLCVSFLFFGWFWTHGGQTLGMRAWKIRVISSSCAPLNWKQALLRFVFAIVSWCVFGFGYWSIAFNRDRRAWHDRLSRTRVVRIDSLPG